MKTSKIKFDENGFLIDLRTPEEKERDRKENSVFNDTILNIIKEQIENPDCMNEDITRYINKGHSLDRYDNDPYPHYKSDIDDTIENS